MIITHPILSINSIYSLVSVLINTDNLVGVTGKDGVRVSTPSNRDTSRSLRILLALLLRSGIRKFSDARMVLKIEDLDVLLSGSAEPELVGVENKLINFTSGLKAVKELTFLKVIDEDGALLTSSSAEGALRRNTNSAEVASSTSEGVKHFEFLTKAPDLDNTIPAARNCNRSGSIGREGNIRNPLGVTLVLKSELAFTKSVPELHKTITTARHDLTVISRESNTKNILSVANKATSADTVGKIPKTEGVIPAAGKSIVTIVRQFDVFNKVAVTVETTLSMSVFLGSADKFPHHNSPVPRTGDEQVRTLASCSQSSDWSIMSLDFCGKLERSHLR